MQCLAGDALLSSAFVSYCGFFDNFHRGSLFASWKTCCASLRLDVSRMLSVPEFLTGYAQRYQWQEFGLGNDRLSIENAAILSKAIMHPFIIDPSKKVAYFLEKQYSGEKFLRTTFRDPGYRKTLENALRFGCNLLIEDVQDIDPMILNVLGRDTRKKSGGRVVLRLGSKDIDFSPSFKLFLMSSDPSFQLPPEICSRVTFINFTVTSKSLQNTLLDAVLVSERPDVSEKRQELLKLQGEYKVRVWALEKQLLGTISTVTGNILENEDVVNTLQQLQIEGGALLVKSSEATRVLEDIEAVTKEYVPLTECITGIFFTLDRLSSLNSKYQFTLEWFLETVRKLLSKGKGDRLKSGNNVQSRIAAIEQQILVELYTRVQPSLLHVHQLPFLFNLAQLKTDLLAQIDNEWFKYLSDSLLPPCQTTSNSITFPHYVPEELCSPFKKLTRLPYFKNLTATMANNEQAWKELLVTKKSVVDPVKLGLGNVSGQALFVSLFTD